MYARLAGVIAPLATVLFSGAARAKRHSLRERLPGGPRLGSRYLRIGPRSHSHVSSDYPRELASAGTAAGPPRSNRYDHSWRSTEMG